MVSADYFPASASSAKFPRGGSRGLTMMIMNSPRTVAGAGRCGGGRGDGGVV